MRIRISTFVTTSMQTGSWELPFGRGKKFLSDAGKITNGILGGWDMTGILRWNSGLPTAGTRPFAFQRWATNWQISSGMVACPSRSKRHRRRQW